MLLYGLYRKVKPAAELEKKVPEHIVNIVVVGNSEQIHPVKSEKNEDMIKKLDEEVLAAEENRESSVISPPVPALLPVANDHENEERAGGELAQVNLQPQQQFETPVLVVCAAA